MQFIPNVDSLGKISYDLDWTVDCDQFPYGLQNEFDVMFILEDIDSCGIIQPDTVYYSFDVVIPPNQSPNISIEEVSEDITITAHIDEMTEFVVFAQDPDGDTVTLKAVGNGFDLDQYNMSFDENSGLNQVSVGFSWDNQCGLVDLFETDTLEVLFIAEDVGVCQSVTYDTLKVTFIILPPINTAPQVYVNGSNSPDTINILANEWIDIDVIAIDDEGDSIFLFLLNEQQMKESLGIEFEAVPKSGVIETNFSWQSSCEDLSPNFKDSTYAFVFITFDDKCYSSKTDTTVMLVKVSDIPSSYNFQSANVFTPNKTDAINQNYFIPDLPVDNCFSQFLEFIVYNRWGRPVFTSKDRNFRWDGGEVASGVYYYTLKYSHTTYRGYISVLR